jgi:hypothetical protein
MHTLEIPRKSIVREFPSELEEMTSAQYQLYVDLVLQYNAGKIKEVELKSRLVQCLLVIRSGFGFGFITPAKRQECLTNVIRLSELMDCFIEEHEKDQQIYKSFKLTSTRNFIPRLLGYHGPTDGFANLTFCEYRIARDYFRRFAETGQEPYLNYLVAVLYRPARHFSYFRRYKLSWDGEIRIPFKSNSNPSALEKRAKRLSMVPFHLRYCVFLYFAGCEEFLKAGKPVIDGVELDFSLLYSESSSHDKTNVGMIGLLYSLAESGVFGTIETTDNQNLWDILVRVYQVVMQSREITSKTAT